MNAWWAESDAGYRVVISRAVDGYVYLAYGPAVVGWREALKVRYERGEVMPRDRECLGRATSADEARAICDQHHGDSEHAAAE